MSGPSVCGLATDSAKRSGVLCKQSISSAYFTSAKGSFFRRLNQAASSRSERCPSEKTRRNALTRADFALARRSTLPKANRPPLNSMMAVLPPVFVDFTESFASTLLPFASKISAFFRPSGDPRNVGSERSPHRPGGLHHDSRLSDQMFIESSTSVATCLARLRNDPMMKLKMLGGSRRHPHQLDNFLLGLRCPTRDHAGPCLGCLISL